MERTFPRFARGPQARTLRVPVTAAKRQIRAFHAKHGNEDCVSVFNQYVIRVKRRDELVEHLQERGVGSVVYYPLGLHVQECFRYLGYKDGDFPETEKAAREVLALPIYPELTREMLDAVVEAVLSFVS